MKVIHSTIGILLLVFNLNMRSCTSSDVTINGTFKECVNLNDQTQKMFFEIDNQSDSSFYVNTADIFYKLEITQGNKSIAPFRKGETPLNPKMILVVSGVKQYELNTSFLRNYPLDGEEYLLNLFYKNTQKNLNGKQLLTGEYNIRGIPFKICNK